MSYDKDWEVYLALNDPNDPIHEIIEKQLEREGQDGEPETPASSEGSAEQAS